MPKLSKVEQNTTALSILTVKAKSSEESIPGSRTRDNAKTPSARGGEKAITNARATLPSTSANASENLQKHLETRLEILRNLIDNLLAPAKNSPMGNINTDYCSIDQFFEPKKLGARGVVPHLVFDNQDYPNNLNKAKNIISQNRERIIKHIKSDSDSIKIQAHQTLQTFEEKISHADWQFGILKELHESDLRILQGHSQSSPTAPQNQENEAPDLYRLRVIDDQTLFRRSKYLENADFLMDLMFEVRARHLNRADINFQILEGQCFGRLAISFLEATAANEKSTKCKIDILKKSLRYSPNPERIDLLAYVLPMTDRLHILQENTKNLLCTINQFRHWEIKNATPDFFDKNAIYIENSLFKSLLEETHLVNTVYAQELMINSSDKNSFLKDKIESLAKSSSEFYNGIHKLDVEIHSEIRDSIHFELLGYAQRKIEDLCDEVHYLKLLMKQESTYFNHSNYANIEKLTDRSLKALDTASQIVGEQRARIISRSDFKPASSYERQILQIHMEKQHSYFERKLTWLEAEIKNESKSPTVPASAQKNKRQRGASQKKAAGVRRASTATTAAPASASLADEIAQFDQNFRDAVAADFERHLLASKCRADLARVQLGPFDQAAMGSKFAIGEHMTEAAKVLRRHERTLSVHAQKLRDLNTRLLDAGDSPVRNAELQNLQESLEEKITRLAAGASELREEYTRLILARTAKEFLHDAFDSARLEAGSERHLSSFYALLQQGAIKVEAENGRIKLGEFTYTGEPKQQPDYLESYVLSLKLDDKSQSAMGLAKTPPDAANVEKPSLFRPRFANNVFRFKAHVHFAQPSGGDAVAAHFKTFDDAEIAQRQDGTLVTRAPARFWHSRQRLALTLQQAQKGKLRQDDVV